MLLDFVHDSTSSGNAGCSVDFLIEGAKADIHLTKKIEALWLSRSLYDVENVVWTYIGTATGFCS